MTTYYVRKTGSDSADGLTPGTAFLTVGKASNTVSLTTGDTIYIGAGVYREVISYRTGLNSQTYMIGDTDGSKTGDAGEVQITAYLTSNTAAPSGSTLIVLGTSSYRNWTFQNIVFVGGSGSPKLLQISGATNITFTDCVFLGYTGVNTGLMSITATTTANILFERCLIFGIGGLTNSLTTSATADFDSNIIYRNCVVSTGNLIDITGSGANSFKGGGVCFYSCTLFNPSNPSLRVSNANVSTTYPCKVENCIIIGTSGATGISANVSGQIIEDYNIIVATTPRANVSAGANSISDNSRAVIFNVGQELLWGGSIRPYLSPANGSGFLGFGSSTNAPSVDRSGDNRPSGGRSALKSIGAYERGNTFQEETTVINTGTNAFSCLGPGYQDFYFPVTAGARTISVYLRYDGIYAGTKPQISLRGGGKIGVADQIVTASSSALDAWEKNTVSFTPTKAGTVIIRIISGDTNGNGKLFMDTFGMT